MSEAEGHQPGDFPSWPITDAAIRAAFEAMLRDGSWGRYHGPHCDQLRHDLAEFHNVEHAILCSSGTSAVELALRAAKVEPGDEVILAAYDYKANFANVIGLGAIPVLVDTLPGVPVLDPDQLPDAVSDKTRAIICSHLHGSFAPMDQIVEFARQHGLPVIEDACQATGGILNGKVAGSIGDVGVLSFGGSKLMTAGRGGAVVTNDATIAQRIRLYTQRGNDAYPLSEMQAAVLVPQLQQLPQRNQQRLNAVEVFLSELGNTIIAAVSPAVDLSSAVSPAFYKLALRWADARGSVTRDDFAASARSAGVALDPGFPALHQIHAKRRFRAVGDLPNATDLHEKLLILHHPILLQSMKEVTEAARRLAAATVAQLRSGDRL